MKMVLRIEIKKIDYNNRWEIREGDIGASTSHSNIMKDELLSDIADLLKAEEEKYCSKCGKLRVDDE
jgi:hypothetical protein